MKLVRQFILATALALAGVGAAYVAPSHAACSTWLEAAPVNAGWVQFDGCTQRFTIHDNVNDGVTTIVNARIFDGITFRNVVYLAPAGGTRVVNMNSVGLTYAFAAGIMFPFGTNPFVTAYAEPVPVRL